MVLYEVFKKVLRERGEHPALQVAGTMDADKFVPVDATLALDAARYPLPLADSLIHATAQQWGATVWTQDAAFKGRSGVQYFAKPVTRHVTKARKT